MSESLRKAKIFYSIYPANIASLTYINMNIRNTEEKQFKNQQLTTI